MLRRGVQSNMAGTQIPTGRPSTPGKPGKPCKEPRQSWQASRSLPPPNSPACPPGMLPIPGVWYPAQGTYGRSQEAP